MIQRIPLSILVVSAGISVSAFLLSGMSVTEAAHGLFGVGLLILMGICYVRLFFPTNLWRDRTRLTWFLLATVAMVVPFLCWVASRHLTVPRTYYAVPSVLTWKRFFFGLAVVQPFLAAIFLGLAWKQPPASTGTTIVSHHRPLRRWVVSTIKYVFCLCASTIVTCAIYFSLITLLSL